MSLPFVGIGRRGVSDNERCSCADLVCSLGGRNVLNQRRSVTFSVPTRPARPLYAIICSTIFSQQYCRTIRPNFPDSLDILQKLVASEKHLGNPEIPERFHEKFGNLKDDSLKICDNISYDLFDFNKTCTLAGHKIPPLGKRLETPVHQNICCHAPHRRLRDDRMD